MLLVVVGRAQRREEEEEKEEEEEEEEEGGGERREEEEGGGRSERALAHLNRGRKEGRNQRPQDRRPEFSLSLSLSIGVLLVKEPTTQGRERETDA